MTMNTTFVSPELIIEEINKTIIPVMKKIEKIRKKYWKLSDEITKKQKEIKSLSYSLITATTTMGKDDKVIGHTKLPGSEGKLVVLFSSPPLPNKEVYLISYEVREGKNTRPDGTKTKYVKCFTWSEEKPDEVKDKAEKIVELQDEIEKIKEMQKNLENLRKLTEEKYDDLCDKLKNKVINDVLVSVGIDPEKFRKIIEEIPDFCLTLKNKFDKVEVREREEDYNYYLTVYSLYKDDIIIEIWENYDPQVRIKNEKKYIDFYNVISNMKKKEEEKND